MRAARRVRADSPAVFFGARDHRTFTRERVMALKTLQDLFADELKDVYDAEHRITKALPMMIKGATSPELTQALQNHLRETEEHVERLEQVFEECGDTPTRKTCQAMVGLLKEGDELLEEKGPESVRDAAIIAACQKVEHYEMATYGCLRTWAKLLGMEETSQLLQRTLDEEGQADKKLTQCSQKLNVEAVEGSDESEGTGDEDGNTRQAVTVGRRSSSGSGGSGRANARRKM